MIFTCTQENLHRGFGVVSHVASRATTLPILSNILMEIQGNTLVLSATNLEIGVQTKVRGRAEEEGKIVVPAKLISECVSLLPRENVSITQEGENLKVQSGSFENKIHTVPADDFPLLPVIEKQIAFSLHHAKLNELIQATLFAASFDYTRPELAGVYMHIVKGKLTAAATNSYRLAEKSIEITNQTIDLPGVIIPIRTMQEVARILPLSHADQGEEDMVEVVIGQHQVSFMMGDTVMVSRLIEGLYPAYQEIIPSTYESLITVEKELLAQALRAASLFSKSGMNDISLMVLPEEQGVRLRAMNIHVGENTTVVPAKVEGKSDEVVLNWRYLAEGLESITTESVNIEVTNSKIPVLLKPSGVKDHLYLIMPIRQ
ncbi:MAG: DNA polymerase III subunit beta [Patescibacteria group bacterium]